MRTAQEHWLQQVRPRSQRRLPESEHRTMVRPNIVYIHSHDTGRYVQPYGYAVSTPNLQRLAEQGVLFRQAFSAAPTCSPSRAALLTGQAAHSSGMLGLAHLGFALKDVRQHVLHTLRQEAGYVSALFGIQHLAHQSASEEGNGKALGYDLVVPRSDQTAVDAARFLSETSNDRPFFLDIGFFETHRHGKYNGNGMFNRAGPLGDGRYSAPPAPLPDTPETRADMADYGIAAARLDQKIGVVLDAIDAHGIANTTLVICTTDHGIPFPGMKCTLTDHGTGVMLLMRGPGGFTGGRVCDALVSQIDLFPTLCDSLSIARPAWLHGRSIMPLIRREVDRIRDETFAEVTYHAAYEPQRSVRTTRWKYIRRFADPPSPGTNCDTGPSKDVWRRSGWPTRFYESEQLYDLVLDPNETDNVIADPASRDPLRELRGRLERWMRETDDPLLRGPVPPPGSWHNREARPFDALSSKR